MIIIISIIIFLLSLGMLWNFTKRPLSEDDGNWFYLAKFWKNGVRPFKVFKQDDKIIRDVNHVYTTTGYFNLNYFIALIYNYLIPSMARKISVFYPIKIVWLSLTNVFLFIFLITQGMTLLGSFWGAMIYSYVIACSKKNWTDLTYAEIYLVFPMLLSFIAMSYSVSENMYYLSLLAGILAGFAFQMKITSLPVLLSFAVYSGFHFPLLVFCFLSGFVCINLMPVLWIFMTYSYEKRASIIYYLRSLFAPVATIFYLLYNKFRKTNQINIEAREKKGIFSSSGYVLKMNTRNKNTKKKSDILKAMHSQLSQFPMIYFLVCYQFIYLFFSFNGFVLFNLVSLLFWVLVILAQNKKYYPTFNSVWINISVLAGFSYQTLYQTHNLQIKIILILGTALEIYHWYLNLRFETIKDNTNKLAHFLEKKQITLQKSGLVAQDIVQYIKDNDRFLVWGNLPNLHIYADRMSFNWNLFAYPNAILKDFTFYFDLWNAPRVIFWCPPIKEPEWNVVKINETFRTSYEVIKTYPFGVGEKKSFLLLLDEPLYIEILLEQAFEIPRFDYFKSENNRKWLLHCMNKIKKINPDHFLANFYEKTELNPNNQTDNIVILMQMLEKSNVNVEKSALFYLLGNEYAKNDDIQSAFKSYSEALMFNQSDWKIYNGLGECYAMMSDIKNALECLKKAHELNPYSSKVYGNLAYISYYIGDIKQAIILNEKALRINPNNKEALANAEFFINEKIQ